MRRAASSSADRPPAVPLQQALHCCRGGLLGVAGFRAAANVLLVVAPVYIESEDGDKPDVSGLKEDLEAGATLTFMGTTAFSGAGAGTPSVGEVRYEQKGEDTSTTEDDFTHVTADINGDGNADFQVTLEGLHTLTGEDVILA